jgi:formylglycine-generating enzyme required for sulfatase activity
MDIRKVFHKALAFILIAPISAAAIASQGPRDSVDLVTIGPGSHHYRASGAFLKQGRPVDAPILSVRIGKPLTIMKYQVSAADYSRCVSDGACGRPSGKRRTGKKNSPVTGVSYLDVQDYINWLSARTGDGWRLPTDLEWSYAAGSRFFDDALGEDLDKNPDPSARSLAKYKSLAALGRSSDRGVRVRGFFGANEHGLFDLSGNVWEWTSTCFTRTEITKSGRIDSVATNNCGVRVVEGRHRAYITDFIQDAKSGGCSVGAPPDYLGFRLVKDDALPGIIDKLRGWWIRRTSVDD